MNFACLYICDFITQAVVRSEPALRERAVAVVDGVAPLVKVIGVNKKARQAGIQIGMTKVQVTQFPSVEVRQRSPAQEASAHAALLDCAYAFSPVIEATARDTVVLDLAGLGRLLGKSHGRTEPSLPSFSEEIAHCLAARVSDLGLKANVALASNPDAAVCAGRGFPGISLIPFGSEAEHLGGLPVEVLAPPAEIVETLRRWGVRTFRELASLPALPLSERLGQPGLRLQALARGTGSRPLVRWEPEVNFEEAMELEHPLALLDPLMFVLARLIDQLCLRLAARVLATNELRLRMELDRQSSVASRQLSVADDNGLRTTDYGQRNSDRPAFTATYEKALRLPVPMRDSKVFLKLLQLALKSDPPQAPVLKVTLAAEPVKPRVAQRGLFLPLSPDPEKLEIVLARIAGVVGQENVGSAELVDTHRPGTFRMRRFNPANPAPHGARVGAPQACSPPMALRVFRPPLRATVEVRAGRPARIFAGRVRGAVVCATGPWRTSGDWWRDDAWEHEEWDVELERPSVVSCQLSVAPDACKRQGTTSVVPMEASKRNLNSPSLIGRTNPASDAQRTTDDGQRTGLYRVYRDLATGSWFVQGSYD